MADAVIDTTNKFMVGRTVAGSFAILAPPRHPMSNADALILAAYLVALSDDPDDFPAILAAVSET